MKEILVPVRRCLSPDEVKALSSAFPDHELSQREISGRHLVVLSHSSELDAEVRKLHSQLAYEIARVLKSHLVTREQDKKRSVVAAKSQAVAAYVQDIGDHHLILHPPLVSAIKELDEKLLSLYKGLGAEEYILPTLLPSSLLHANPADNLQSKAFRLQGRPSDANEPHRYLSYAACLPLYPALAGMQISRPRLFTANTLCFRPEDHYSWPRLREYRVRELVLVGSPADVESLLQQCVDAVLVLMRTLDIAIDVIPASDPFTQAPGQVAFQELTLSKREFWSPALQTAVGSANLHRALFSKCWDIKCEADWAATACVGIGLERMASAYLDRNS